MKSITSDYDMKILKENPKKKYQRKQMHFVEIIITKLHKQLFI